MAVGVRRRAGALGMRVRWVPWSLAWAVLQLGWRPGWLLGNGTGDMGSGWGLRQGSEGLAPSSAMVGKGALVGQSPWGLEGPVCGR